MVRAGPRFSVTTWAVCTNTKEPGDGSAQTGHRTCPTRRDGGSKATEAPLDRGFFATRSLTKKRAATPASLVSKASCRSAWARPTAPAVPATGSRARIRQHPRQARGRRGLGQREMAITQGKMPFVFGMIVLATLLVAAPAAHAACRSPKNICKHVDDCLQR